MAVAIPPVSEHIEQVPILVLGSDMPTDGPCQSSNTFFFYCGFSGGMDAGWNVQPLPPRYPTRVEGKRMLYPSATAGTMEMCSNYHVIQT